METPAEFAAIINTAHRLHRRVATHSAGLSAANQIAIEAGTDSIEHGPLSDANIAAMAKRGTAYTPTLITTKLALESGKVPMPPEHYQRTLDSVTKAHKAGITILFGSDLPVAPIKDIPREFVLMQDAGLTPAEALRTATINAARALDRGDTLGSLAPGKFADVIALPANPLEDLKQMAKIGFVMKDGKVVRNDFPVVAHP
jgi:imidazolonepropionase-like amidohydrolase